MGVSEEKDIKKQRDYFNVKVVNFPNQRKIMGTQIYASQWIPGRINLKRPTMKCFVIKLSKSKDKENIESSKRKLIYLVQGILNM